MAMDVGASALFIPDSVLPAQFAALRQPRELPPEKRLLAAVLEQAIDDLIPKTLHDVNGPAEAEEWLLSDTRAWPMVFAAICDTFGLDVQAARAALLEQARQESALRRILLADARTVTEAKGLRWIKGRSPWVLDQLADGIEASYSTARKLVGDWLAGGTVRRAGVRQSATNAAQQYVERVGL